MREPGWPEDCRVQIRRGASPEPWKVLAHYTATKSVPGFTPFEESTLEVLGSENSYDQAIACARRLLRYV